MTAPPPWLPRTMLVLLVAYLALTVAILVKSPILDVDQSIRNLHLRQNYPHSIRWWHDYVTLGQRVPVIQALLPLLGWLSYRRRSAAPLVSLYVSVVVLNLSVGVVKLISGRVGPRGGHPVDQIFAGGDIYPSGHTSNSAAIYGLIVLFASPRFRRGALAAVVFVCVTIGIGTIFLNTHWFTDVIGGWLAGGLVLCTLPWLVPHAERIVSASYSPVRAAVSVLGAALPMYFGLGFITRLLGHYINDVFGGQLALGLIASSLPWLTPPLEARIRAVVASRRAPRAASHARD